ncbi:MAG TPA: SOS response-associated peptidase [Acidimicrobiales bacterium]|nr:SOS response-associated peptidase [Acidimicrobiales bacterium]
MCGRVVSSLPRNFLAEHFSAEEVASPELPPSYNTAPGAMLYVVAEGRAGRRVGTMRWGLVPPWADSPERGPRPINAAAETLLSKQAFAEAMRSGRRCLVPVSGFFEFKSSPEGKQPYLLTRPDGFPLAMAGLWSRWSLDGGETVVTFTIVTTAANEDVAPLHDRMPALLTRENWDSWLDRRAQDAGRLCALLAPSLTGSLVHRPVSRRVNDARNDDATLLSV